jgi:hypothetical protein
LVQVEAMRSTVDALRAAGRLELADDALVAMALGLAAVVDSDPGNASLWREYRAVELRLRETGGADAGDEFTDALRRLRSADSDTTVV